MKKTTQSVQSFEFAFEGGISEALAALTRLPMVSQVRKEGDKIRLYTDDLTPLLEEIMQYTRVCQNRLVSETTRGPTPEDVFIHLTGLQPPVKGGGDVR